MINQCRGTSQKSKGSSKRYAEGSAWVENYPSPANEYLYLAASQSFIRKKFRDSQKSLKLRSGAQCET